MYTNCYIRLIDCPYLFPRTFSAAHYSIYAVYCTCSVAHYSIYAVYCTCSVAHYSIYAVHCTCSVAHYSIYAVYCTCSVAHYSIYAVYRLKRSVSLVLSTTMVNCWLQQLQLTPFDAWITSHCHGCDWTELCLCWPNSWEYWSNIWSIFASHCIDFTEQRCV